MHTLTMTGTGLAGRPDTGDLVSVFNVDNLLKFGDPVETTNVFYHGSAKFSVPAGHYMAIGAFLNVSAATITSVRLVILPQFTVAGDTTAGVAEATASNQVQMVTPQPAVTQDVTLTIDRVTGNGDELSDGFDAGTFRSGRTRPRRRRRPAPCKRRDRVPDVAAGRQPGVRLQPRVRGNRRGHRAAAVRGDPGQHRRHERRLPPGRQVDRGMDAARLLRVPEGRPDLGRHLPFRLPQSLDQYFSAGPALFWTNAYYQSDAALAGGQTDSARTFSPGETASQNWNAYPLHPGPDVNLLGAANPFPELPSASRAGNTLTLVVTPFSDNTLGHTGSGLSRHLRQRGLDQRQLPAVGERQEDRRG